ncbi:hypothetical protein CHCC14814_1048 [Bacillus paralicheniformis]|nr:hypothetical protein CHCC14814_1048 [Bacillus paralicheniformis]
MKKNLFLKRVIRMNAITYYGPEIFKMMGFEKNESGCRTFWDV